jgi:hypothetical protein
MSAQNLAKNKKPAGHAKAFQILAEEEGLRMPATMRTSLRESTFQSAIEASISNRFEPFSSLNYRN